MVTPTLYGRKRVGDTSIIMSRTMTGVELPLDISSSIYVFRQWVGVPRYTTRLVFSGARCRSGNYMHGTLATR